MVYYTAITNHRVINSYYYSYDYSLYSHDYSQFIVDTAIMVYTLWLFNITMENPL